MNKRHLLPNGFISLTFLWGFVFYYCFANPVMLDPDTSWHLAAGDLIRSSGIPEYNPWSYAAENVRWYNISWLWDCMLSLIAENYGLSGLYIAGCIFYAATLAFISHSLLSRKEIPANAAIFTVFLITIILWDFQSVRPHVFTLLMAAIFQHILHKNSRYMPYILPLLMMLWANIHGGFLVGLSLIGAYGLQSIIEKNKADFIRLLITGLLCCAAIFITPLGFDIIPAVLRSLKSIATGSINEWQPFILGQAEFMGTTIFFMLFILTSNPREKNICWADKITAFLWLLMAMASIRNVAIAAIVAAPYVSRNIAEADFLRRLPDFSSLRERVAVLALTVIAVFIMSFPPLREKLTGRDIVMEDGVVTKAAVDFIMEKYPDINFLNNYETGGHIIYYSRGLVKVFVDGRAGTAYPESVLSDYIEKDAPEEMLEHYNINGVITWHNRSYYKRFKEDSGWQQVYNDEKVAIFIKKGRL